jgi:hypothetical protein
MIRDACHASKSEAFFKLSERSLQFRPKIWDEQNPQIDSTATVPQQFPAHFVPLATFA